MALSIGSSTMIEKLSAGMKSWIIQDYLDICENPAEYGIADIQADYSKVIDIIEEDVNAKFETRIPRELIDACLSTTKPGAPFSC